MLGTQEHYDLIAMFEREFKGTERMDREDKSQWKHGHVYQHGMLNQLFLAYQRGYAFGKAAHREPTHDQACSTVRFGQNECDCGYAESRGESR